MILTIAMLIFLLPLAGFVVMALTHKRIPRHGDWLATSLLGASLILSLVLFRESIRSASPLMANLVFPWLPTGHGTGLLGGLMVDRLTAMMLVVVTLVSFLVHLFSSKYMEGDIRYGRYYCGLLIFTTSMLGLVLANNLLYLFVFWELVGLSSYLLIGHWYEKKSASDAAIKAFITTRVGDVGMFIGIMICYLKVGSLQYADLFAAVETGALAGGWQTAAGLGIFLGAMGKSAQFPLHVWLPDAMEGPTPVSALIHAATMVAAGVYLVGRVLPMFDAPSLLFIAYTGAFTAFFAATIALVQDDIKKVLAYSTVSQLGYMILGLGVGGYTSGLFHLTTHAFFKACLFLGSGAVIWAMHHEQSMSKYGGLRHKMPKTAFLYLLATLALCGVYPFSGFWSKDSILADALVFDWSHEGHWFLPVAGFTTAFMTAFYMFRQYLLTFTGKPRDHHAYDHAKEPPWPMLLPLVILGVLALIGGGLKGEWFGKLNPKLSGIEQVRLFAEAGYTSPIIEEALKLPAAPEGAAGAHGEATATAHGEATVAHGEVTTTAHGEAAHGEAAAARHGEGHGGDMAHHAHGLAMKLSSLLGVLGIMLGFAMYYERKSSGRSLINPVLIATPLKPVHTLLTRKYYLDELYMAALVMSTRALARFSAVFDRVVIDSVVNFMGLLGRVGAFVVDVADRLFVDDWFVNGSARATRLAGEKLSYAQTGRVRQYLVFMVLGLVVLGMVLILVM